MSLIPASLVLATRNPHKLREFERLLAPAAIAVEPLPDGVELPPEVGDTFEANALPKARTRPRPTGRAAIADDSGIEAEALGGRPGVRSARYAGLDADDQREPREAAARGAGRQRAALRVRAGLRRPGERHRAGLLRRLPRPAGRRSRAGIGGFGYDPAFLPDGDFGGRTMAELTDEEKDAISHRGRAVRALLALAATGQRDRGRAQPRGEAKVKRRAAALSVVSNSALILLKVIAGTVTGSVAILTEAVHSSIDLVASIVAFFSVRKADEPADESHRYGHEKIENLAAAIEGILILVGSAAIAFEAIRHLISHGRVQMVGHRHRGDRRSRWSSTWSSRWRLHRAAKRTESPALAGDAAHLGTDALTSAAVLIGLVLVAVTGAQWIDPVVALAVACVIVITGVRLLAQSSRVLVDESLPPAEVEAIREAIEAFAGRGVVGYHELRTRRAGARRYVDLHVQFREGTSLEERPPDRARAAGRDRRAAARRRRADPPRARGPRAAGGGAARRAPVASPRQPVIADAGAGGAAIRCGGRVRG